MAEKKETKEQENQEIEVSEELQEIIDQISELNVLQLSELVKALEDKFGVTATVPTVAQAAPAGGGEEEEEKSVYDVVLKSDGGNKIPVIKALRKLKSDLGLKEAKGLVDEAPSTIEEEIPTEEAKKMKEALEEAGGEVELK